MRQSGDDDDAGAADATTADNGGGGGAKKGQEKKKHLHESPTCWKWIYSIRVYSVHMATHVFNLFFPTDSKKTVTVHDSYPPSLTLTSLSGLIW